MNTLRDLLSRFRLRFLVPQVGAIVSDLEAKIEQLGAAVERHDDEAMRLMNKGRALLNQAAVASAEADRGFRVMERLRDLID